MNSLKVSRYLHILFLIYSGGNHMMGGRGAQFILVDKPSQIQKYVSSSNYVPKNPQAVNIPPTAIDTKSNPVVTFLDSIGCVLSVPNEAEMKPFAVSEKSIQPYWTNALNLFSGMSLQFVTSSSEISYSEIEILKFESSPLRIFFFFFNFNPS